MLSNLSLKKKILLVTVGPLTLVMLLIAGAAIYNKINSERGLLLGRLISFRTLLESGDVTFASSGDKAKLETLFDETVDHTEILRDPQTPFFSTLKDGSGNPMLPQYTSYEKAAIEEAFQGVESNALSGGIRPNTLTYTSPIIVNGNLVAVLHQSLSFEQSNQRIRNFALFILGAIALGVLMCYALISWLLGRTVLANVYRLKEAALAMSHGQLDVTLDLKPKDEIGDLTRTFDQMRTAVTDYRSKLEANNQVLKQEKTRFLASINALSLGFMLTDANQRVLMLNPTLHKMFKIPIDSDLAVSNERQHTLIRQLLEHSKKCIETQKDTSYEFTTEKGHYYRSLMAPIISAEGVSGVVILVEDVTEARVLARSRDEFFSIASHELRTPLTAIRGNTSMIKNMYADQLKDPDLETMIDDIYGSSVRLIEIVNDFLDVSSLEQRKMKFTPANFSIEKVIEGVIYEMSGMANEHDVQVIMKNNLDSLPLVHADANRTKQIVYNLIGNAIKFTEKGTVTIRGEIEGKRYIKVYVTDTGRGISSKNQALLFHKFQQAGSSILTRDTTKGTGLGLYISKLLTEHMGGKMVLENSAEGKGTTFSFTLPIADSGKKSDSTAESQ